MPLPPPPALTIAACPLPSFLVLAAGGCIAGGWCLNPPAFHGNTEKLRRRRIPGQAKDCVKKKARAQSSKAGARAARRRREHGDPCAASAPIASLPHQPSREASAQASARSFEARREDRSSPGLPDNQPGRSRDGNRLAVFTGRSRPRSAHPETIDSEGPAVWDGAGDQRPVSMPTQKNGASAGELKFDPIKPAGRPRPAARSRA